MKHSDTPGQDPLLELLRRGDPARAIAQEAAERIVGAMRREISRDKTPVPIHLGWRAALVAACLLVVALAGLWRNAPAPEDSPRTPPAMETQISAVGVEPEGTASLPKPQQIQFRTPGGTRIIWVLTPESNPERRAL